LREIETAIDRYCTVLETRLGGEGELEASFRAWRKLAGNASVEGSPEERERRDAWLAAHDEASQAGALVLALPLGNYFDVHVLSAFFTQGESKKRSKGWALSKLWRR
jgi:hypothetical protein